MLILHRRAGESIIIQDDILFTVLGFKGGQVTLGFDAPESVVIHRYELYKKLKAEKHQIFGTMKYCPSSEFDYDAWPKTQDNHAFDSSCY